MTAKPETLRTYALIFESPKECHDGRVRPASQACKAAAEALRFQADAISMARSESLNDLVFTPSYTE